MTAAIVVALLGTCYTSENPKKLTTREAIHETMEANDINAGLINLFGEFTGESDSNIASFFSGIFLSESQVNQLVLDTQKQIKLTGNKRKNQSVVRTRKFRKPVGTIQMNTQSNSNSSNRSKEVNCCETQLDITAPDTVLVDGKYMSVVHMNHSYQYVTEGSCVNSGQRCRHRGVCTQIYKYAFILLYDINLADKVNPPVRYGRVEVRSHCECRNIGRNRK